MIATLSLRTVDQFENQTGQSADYLRDIVSSSPGAFGKFMLAMPFANHRRSLPKDAWHLARLIASQREDCGPCTQITVDFAVADGVDPGLLRAVLDDRAEDLSEPLQAVCRLAASVANADADAALLGEKVVEHYGQEALVDIGFAIAGVRIFPTLKRALGHAISCSRVEVRIGDGSAAN